MKILTCPNCKNILLAIDGLLSINIPLPESIIQAEVKCKCGQTVRIDIINKLQSTRYDWPTEERFFINRDEV